MSNVRPFDLRVKGLKYHVKDGVSIRTILDIEHLEIASGEVLGIRGTSGSGKSTFLKLISGIVTPQLGTVSWGNELLSHCSEARRDDWRGRNCGFLFQDFRLFGGLSALDNALLPLTFRGKITGADRDRAEKLLRQYGVPAETQASLLSRGEMQRTALVRVLISSPKVILADEPTASLDYSNAFRVMEALINAAFDLKATLLVVTHDSQMLKCFNRVLTIENGTIRGPGL